MYQMQVRVGRDGVLGGDFESGLGQDPPGIDSRVDQVDCGADPLGVVLRERPVSAVDAPIARGDSGVHVYDGAVCGSQYAGGDNASSVYDDDCRSGRAQELNGLVVVD